MESQPDDTTRITFAGNALKLRTAQRLGVALGPGLPFGLVGLGLLLVLQQSGKTISMISGTSMGAILGALYATGLSPEEMRERAIEIFSRNSQRFRRLLQPESVIKELIDFTGWDPHFHELMVPLFITAADKRSQKTVILNHGRVFEAVQASMTYPVHSRRVEIGDMELADGAVFSSLNTDVLYSEGADFVIGIQGKLIVSEADGKLPLTSRLKPYLLKFTGWRTTPDTFFSKPGCEILLRPRVPKDLASDPRRVGDIIELGVRTTHDALAAIDAEASVDPRKNHTTPGTHVARIDGDINTQLLEIEDFLADVAERVASLSDGELTEEFPRFTQSFRQLWEALGNTCRGAEGIEEMLQTRVRRLKQLIDESPFMKRALDKPRGYAGDYQMMNYIYEDDVFGARTNMGKLLNYFVFSDPTTNAVRNRAKIIQGLVQQRLAFLPSLAVASIASGPAREVAQTIKQLASSVEPTSITWTLLDQDREALDYAAREILEGLSVNVRYVNAGVRELVRRRVALGKQDVIYSLGLFDYLEEKVAIAVIRRLYAELTPGGVLVIGNFADHPMRLMMDLVMEWKLLYRREDELLALAESAVPEASHFVMAEPEGVNLILVTSKSISTEED